MNGHTNFACVRFLDDKKKSYCVPIHFIKMKNNEKQLISFHPKDETDFDTNEIYFVQWLCHNECYGDHEHNGYYRAQIGFLAENEAAVKERMQSGRTRYCSLPADVTSSDYEAVIHSGETLCGETSTKNTSTNRTITEHIATDEETSFLNARQPIDDNVATASTTEHMPHDIQSISKTHIEDQRKRQTIDDSYESHSSDASNTYSGYVHKRIRTKGTQSFRKRSKHNHNKLISESSDDSNDEHGSNANVRRCLFPDDANQCITNNNEIRNDDDIVNDENADIVYEEETEIRNSKVFKRRIMERALNYTDSYEMHKRYEKVAHNMVYLGEKIAVGRLSWEITKTQRKPSLFFNDVLVHIWPENILKNRCLNKKRTHYKPSDGTIKILTPKKLSLALSLYNDHLIELHIDDRKRIGYLKDCFTIISAKIRDVRKKH